MQSPQAKICPRCKSPQPLPAQTCGRCGHIFRTVFSPQAGTPQPLVPPVSQFQQTPPSNFYQPPVVGAPRKPNPTLFPLIPLICIVLFCGGVLGVIATQPPSPEQLQANAIAAKIHVGDSKGQVDALTGSQGEELSQSRDIETGRSLIGVSYCIPPNTNDPRIVVEYNADDWTVAAVAN